ncbi:ABC transporter permease [Dyella caseinilytica]|uniref:ABC transporter permease n=1 Tax=Dyella caseinilytica TaxID=1849581 RepID=A0ABX7GRU0_9GAMM|nr:FtsX-like permease family protein [Dyella caseinilytica]QRN52771.1 ABC transporter permease [Dyella caseinilytica]GGA08614.1 ABC transporter permease [Dyella caseinilytica]
MEIRPIFASLRKHRIPTLLIVLQIALACAVLCNAVFMISKRVSDIRLPNAIDEQEISVVDIQGTDPLQAASETSRNLAALRGIGGVEAVSVVHTMPLSQHNWGWSFGLSMDSVLSDEHNTNVTLYFVNQDFEKVLGTRLLQGRYFNSSEYADSTIGGGALPHTHVVVITDTLARQLWPDQPALGKTLYSKPNYYTVVGVVADVLRPDVYTSNRDKSYDDVFLPLSPDEVLHAYILRSAPMDRDRVIREAVAKLQQLSPQAVVEGVTYTSMREKYFANMRSMVWILVLVCVVMLAVTAFGIVGLTSFWVGQRRRQIGIRRAIGATRGDILNYFRTENFLLSSAGVLLGMLLAFGINLYLMRHYELDRMPWYYLPGGALALWVIGQLAVIGPAMRAASVPPVVATQSN